MRDADALHRRHHHRAPPALNRNAIFAGGIRPHHYCLPVLKREAHRRALVRPPPPAARSSSSAPTARRTRPHLKEHACGCAGCYTALAAIELYAEAFDAAGALDKLEGFASLHGADFYGLPPQPRHGHAAKRPWRLPEALPFGDAATQAAARRRNAGLALDEVEIGDAPWPADGETVTGWLAHGRPPHDAPRRMARC